VKHLALILGLATFSTPALAMPISFTGAEFAALPGITFPSGTQTIVGDSLRLDATNTNSSIASLPLDQFNVDVSDFEVQINITRLLRDDGTEDHDPVIFLSDGRNLFGGIFADLSASTVFAQARRSELNSDGRSLVFIETLSNSSGAPVAFNDSYLATIGVQATPTNTIISVGINNGIASITDTTSTLFDLNNGGPSLVLFSNSFSENYLINSVTFTRGVSTPAAVAEPGALGGLALGLATLGFGMFRRRFG